MTAVQQEAFTLHLQRVPVETIAEKTELTRPQIAAAVDLGKPHAQAALQAPAAPVPAAPQPPRIRKAAVRQLPGATIPPSPVLAMPADLKPAAGEPAAAALVTVPAAPAQPARKQQPRKSVKQPGGPVDRDRKIWTLRTVIKVLREQLAKNEAELAELLGTAPDPAPEPAPAAPPKACADPDPATSPEARAWATATGWAVPAVGERLPGAIVLAYLRAHGGTQ